jgi:hypothetical protein
MNICVAAGYILSEHCGAEYEYLDLRNGKRHEDRGNSVITIFVFKFYLRDSVSEDEMGSFFYLSCGK